MTDLSPRVPAGVPTGGQFAATDRPDGSVALAEQRSPFLDISERAGLGGVMGQVFDVVLNRESFDPGVVVFEDTVTAMYEDHIAPQIDRVEEFIDGNIVVERDITADPAAHLEEITSDAGLEGIMGQVLTVIRDREEISDQKLLALTADDVDRLYSMFIVRGIDDVERHLDQL